MNWSGYICVHWFDWFNSNFANYLTAWRRPLLSLSPILFKLFLLHLLGEKQEIIVIFIFWVESCPRYGLSNFDRNSTTCNGQMLVSQTLWHLWRWSKAHFKKYLKALSHWSKKKFMKAQQLILKLTWNL